MMPKDPVMLLSYVNMKLRDFYQDIDGFCQDAGISRQELEEKLAGINYHYSKETNQFV